MSNVLKTFSNKCLSLSYMGENWNNDLMQSIVEAGRTISYVETLNPSKADKFHLSIKGSDKGLFMKEFEKVVRFAVAKLGLKKVKIAFDITEDLTWGRSRFNLRPSVHEHCLMSWQYLSVSVVEPYFFPLMSVPYKQTSSVDNLVIDLIKYIKTLPITVETALFDRGFYHAHLIDFMNSINFPFLILVPKTHSIKNYCEQTASVKFFSHKMVYTKDHSKWQTSVTIIIKRIDDKTCWCYATNQKPSLWSTLEYKKRWNIETGFRIHDETRIKSKSNNSLIRFYYHLLGMLLIVLWRLQNSVRYFVFKRFLKIVELSYTKIIEPDPPPL